MSRSGYSDELDDHWQLIRWRGAVASAIRGRRGQAFLREMLVAMDALPEKKLIAFELEAHGEFCALGAVGKARGMDMASVEVEDHENVAKCFAIPHALACEIMWVNDEWTYWERETPEARFARMRAWVESKLESKPEKESNT